MSTDDEYRRVAEIERAANGKPSYLDMDAAFCARMHAAITAGLESAPIGVITTPGTKKPKYVAPEPLGFSSGAMHMKDFGNTIYALDYVKLCDPPRGAFPIWVFYISPP